MSILKCIHILIVRMLMLIQRFCHTNYLLVVMLLETSIPDAPFSTAIFMSSPLFIPAPQINFDPLFSCLISSLLFWIKKGFSDEIDF